MSYCELNCDVQLSWICGTERRVRSRCGVHDLECVIDRIDRLPSGETRLVDFKTGKSQYVRDIQLETHAYALSHLGENARQLQFQFLGERGERTWAFTDVKRTKTEEWLLGTIDQIVRSKTFPRRPTGLCKYCAVKSLCLF